MSQSPSTTRASAEPTAARARPPAANGVIEEEIRAEWCRCGLPDLPAAIRRHPALVHDKTLLLDLVIDEYRAHRRALNSFRLSQFCSRYWELGQSIHASIVRQLEVQQYFDDNPDVVAAFHEPLWPEPGETVEGYRVIEELGRGALSRVYLCAQAEVGGRQVVVKIAVGGSYEASILGKLNHPNVVPIHSVTTNDDGTSYLCMPFCGRSTLYDLIDVAFRDGPPQRATAIAEAAARWQKPSDRFSKRPGSGWQGDMGSYVDSVLQMLVRIADALAAAHEGGILHGDLKPSNILLSPAGEPLVLDFNLARDHGVETTPFGGTLPYMPPEQLVELADPDGGTALKSTLNTRSEVYSFGALLYHVLAGEPPFPPDGELEDASDTASDLLEMQKAGPRPIRQLNPWVNKSLDEKVIRCLAFHADDRPATMESVKTMLARECRPVSSIRRKVRRRPRAFLAASGVIMAVVISVWGWFVSRPEYHVRQLERGLAYRESGDLTSAVACFENAIREKPQFNVARFEFARTNLQLGEIGTAAEEFSRMSLETENPIYAAYMGYCSNLEKNPLAAIPWYERALDAGLDTIAVHNNLGTCYLMVPGKLSREGQLMAAARHLQRACALDPDSPTVRLNLVRLETLKSSQDKAYDPLSALPHVEFLCRTEPQSPRVWVEAAHTYANLARVDVRWREKAMEALRRAAVLGGRRFLGKFEDSPLFLELRDDPQFAGLTRVADRSGAGTHVPDILAYLEPILGPATVQ